MTVRYRRSEPEDTPQISAYWREHWSGDLMVAHGAVYRPAELDAFIAVDEGEWVGLVTYKLLGATCEIVSLDSLREGQGIGTGLIDKVAAEARQAGCRRIQLTTTNDNLEALGFYQKRGFQIAAVRPGAVNASRRIKPAIPIVGMHGIPLRDEIELEMDLG